MTWTPVILTYFFFILFANGIGMIPFFDLLGVINRIVLGIHYADEHNLENAIIEISDGSLKFQNYKQTSPLTLKFIKTCLSECIQNEQTVSDLMDYIKSKREFKIKNDIKRSYNN